MSWNVRGDDASRDSFIKNANQMDVFRFFLKKGERKEIIFLDDARFGIYEHTIPSGGRFDSYTCSGDDCVFCAHPNKDISYRSYVEYASVLDLTPYTSKKGEKKEFSRKAFGAKKDAKAILDSRRESQPDKTLVGKMFKVQRTGDKSPASGNDFEFVKVANLTKLPPDVKPYDFESVLRPLPPAKMSAIIKYAGGQSASAPSTVSRDSLMGNDAPSSPEAEADIPF